MKYQIVKRKLGNTCRSCLNREFGLDLTPGDCRYAMYPALCDRCGEMCNIVVNIRFSKRMAIRMMPVSKSKPKRLK